MVENNFINLDTIKIYLANRGWDVKNVNNFIFIKKMHLHKNGQKEFISLAIELPNLIKTSNKISNLLQAFIVSPKCKVQFAEAVSTKKIKGHCNTKNHHWWIGATSESLVEKGYSEDAFCISNIHDKRLLKFINNLKNENEEKIIAKLFVMLMESYLRQFFIFRKKCKWEKELRNKQTLSKKDIINMEKKLRTSKNEE